MRPPRGPAYPPRPGAGPATSGAPRPGLLTAAAVATMVGSLVWLCGFTMFWLAVTGAMASIAGVDGYNGTYHLLNSFHLGLVNGGAWAAYVPALVAVVLGGMLLTRAPWVRIATTVWGVIAMAWGAWWQWSSPALWAPAAIYIALVILATWSPDVGRWYRGADKSPPRGLDSAPQQVRMTP